MATTITSNVTLDTVIPTTGYAIVDYYADWCGPCKLIAPILTDIENDRDDVTVIKVNIDHLPELAMTANVSSVPTLHYYKNGTLIGESVGAMPKQRIIANLI